jgi:hypothetical protein
LKVLFSDFNVSEQFYLGSPKKIISKSVAHFNFVSATKKEVISLQLQREGVTELQRTPALAVKR